MVKPDSVRSQQQQDVQAVAVQPDPVWSEPPLDNDGANKHTAVDGQGMWRSWTRVFAKPESACLDLLDNCFDAALQPNFQGKVVLQSEGDSAISIRNNSSKPIKPLEAALTVYKSSKNSLQNTDNAQEQQQQQQDDKEAIGENGVGLKQGCATLSDCSIVLTKNKRTVEVGIIAKSLQSTRGVYLPSFSFNIRDPSNPVDISTCLAKWLSNNAAIEQALASAFGGSSTEVQERVTQYATSLWEGPWKTEDHVFLLVLCKLKKSADAVPHALIDSICPSKAFLHDIKAMLPEYYINLPSNFDFVINDQPIDFSYWQKRLVEMTKFEVSIPTEEPFETLPDETWDQPADGNGKYQLSIYCGFDAQRVDQDLKYKKGTSTCYLYIYSCSAGRLIQKEIDARHMLGLSASGVDFTQGLTVIVNDVAGKLPLTPTKDGIAWSERKHGVTHQKNLIAWTGAVAHFFWNHHKTKIGGKGGAGNKVKENMKKTIRSFAVEDQADQSLITVTENVEEAQFTQFEGTKWRRVQPNYDNRWKIRKSHANVRPKKGADTIFSIDSDRVKRIKEGKSAKRRSITTPGAEPLSKRPRGRVPVKLEEPQSSFWTDVNQNEIPRLTAGVLSYLRAKDKDRLFEVPVLESLPQIKDDYLKVVSQPMDFRTIEERANSYKLVTELRDDLILTFMNCIEFNGDASPYGRIAQHMLDSIEDAFDSMDIRQLTMKALSRLREVDERELFELPVLEQLPGLKDAYMSVVSTPMDFKTIEDERIHSYVSIADLRQDLQLIFQNCINFNGAETAYGEIAQQMLGMLDDTLEDVVLGRRRRKKKVHYEEVINQYDNVGDDEEKVSRKPSAGGGKRKTPKYNELHKQLREERARVKELERRLASQGQYIEELEAMLPSSAGTKRTTERPRRDVFVTPHRVDFDSEAKASPQEGDGLGCRACGKDNDYGKLLLCEGCNAEYHCYCVNLPAVPDEDWYCGELLPFVRCLHHSLIWTFHIGSLPTSFLRTFRPVRTPEPQEGGREERRCFYWVFFFSGRIPTCWNTKAAAAPPWRQTGTVMQF